MNTESQYLKATPEELRLIDELTARPVFERRDAGELEAVSSDDWSDVPELEEGGAKPVIRLIPSLYKRLKEASARKHTTPDALVTEWLREKLG